MVTGSGLTEMTKSNEEKEKRRKLSERFMRGLLWIAGK
jgi:hypothetical protein